MAPATPDVILLSRVCSACGHLNEASGEFCLQCGSPLGNAADRSVRDEDSPSAELWKVFGIDVPLIGRAREVSQLVEAAKEVASSGRARLVCVRGAEGLGKSRLVDAFDQALAESLPDALSLRARARGEDAGAYDVVAQLLSRRFYVPENAPREGFRRRLAEGIASILGGETGPEVAHRVGALLGMPFPGSPWVREARSPESAAAARRALQRLLRADARKNPLVLIVDDVHRAGPETRSLLGELLRGLSDAPILLVCSSASSADLELLGLDAERDPASVIVLGELSDDQTAELVRAMLRRAASVPDELVRRVAERAMGNPLAVEEVLRILVDEGAIDTGEEPWVVRAERLDSVELPFAFDDVVRARLARLSEDERRLLEDAAVVGVRFPLGALIVLDRSRRDPPEEVEAMWGEDDRPAWIRQRLEDLVGRDMLVSCERPELPREVEFTFKHAAEQRLLAAECPADRRADAHRLVAQWLIVQTQDEPERYLSRIGQHFESAGLRSRASEYFARAGSLARSRWHNQRAIENYRRALANLEPRDLTARIEILHDLGSVYDLVGDPHEALPIFTDLARASWALASRAKGGVALSKIGRALRGLGQYDRALGLFDRALALFRSVEDDTGIASTLDDIGKVHWIRGDYGRAEQEYDRALTLRREIGDKRSIALSLHHIGMLLVQRGQFRKALSQFREALSIRRELRDLPGIAESLNTIGIIFAERGEAESASRLWNDALEVAREAGDRLHQGFLHNNLGEVEIDLGRLVEAEENLQLATQIAEECGEKRLQFDAVRNLGVLQSRRGNHRLALSHVEESLDIARSLGSRVMEGIALRTLGELRGQTLFDGAGAQGASGPEGAFRDAISIFQSLGNESELGRAYQAYGTWLLEQGMLVQGKKHLEMAREIFERLEMKRVLARTSETIEAL